MDESAIYEQLYASLYAYQFGRISFMELLARVEQLLGIVSDQTEVVHGD